ncbi:MAG: translation initiation factor eIF-1A [Candidatus Pacearchaeota archaeon]
MEEEFSDFEDSSELGKENTSNEEQNVSSKVRMPKEKQLIGVVVQRFGGNRMEVHASDGKKRNCRIPGRYKKSLWLRPGDVVLIEPWPDNDEKGDIIFKYSSSAVNQLRKKGLLNLIKEEF